MKREECRRESYAHHPTTRTEGPVAPEEADEEPRAEGLLAAAWRLHACLHDDPEEAELGPPEGRPGPADLGDRGHRLHPGRGAQPPRALDRARPRRSRPRPPR